MSHHEHAEHADARLRSAGLRVTQPRRLVYDLLREVGGHLSVGDVARALAERHQALPRVTVHNVLTDLQAAGLVMTADAGPGRTLYEVADTWHHHYVCRECRRVIDVPCVVGLKPCLEPPVDLPGTIDEAQVIFRGVCFDCAPASPSHTQSPTDSPTVPPETTDE